MIRIEEVKVVGWDVAIRGMRNAKNSWDKSDSDWYFVSEENEEEIENYIDYDRETNMHYLLGHNDLELMLKLVKAGTDDRKFMRFITVYVDIVAPFYWWKQFDTYKVGVDTLSCSTMHTIHQKEFTLSDFSYEHLIHNEPVPCRTFSARQSLCVQIEILNMYRELFIEHKDKKYWRQLIQLLPSSYNQRRTIKMNYEVLANIYGSRKNHKLDEWREFCNWIEEEMPYSELITGK